MKFEVIVGNPPYQGVNHQQIYPQFYVWARKNCDQMSMIFPSGWQEPKIKNGLQHMNTEDVKYDKQIVSIDNIVDGFKGVLGAKKTNIIYWKSGYDNGLDGEQLIYTDGKNPVKTKLNITEETVEKPEEIKELLKFVKYYYGDNFKNMEKLVSPMLPYNLHTKFLFDPGFYDLPDTLTNERKNDDDIKVYGVINKKIAYRFVNNKYPIPRKTESFNKFKVFVYSTWGNMSDNYIGGAYSNIIVAYPNDICTESFVEIGCFDTINEVKNLSKYIMSSFFRALLFLNKNQKGCTRKCYKYIPVQDFSEYFWNSDNIDDIDNGLFDKYNVPEEIRKFVRDNIQQRTIDNIIGYDWKDIDLFYKV